jgi:hypothetical protein
MSASGFTGVEVDEPHAVSAANPTIANLASSATSMAAIPARVTRSGRHGKEEARKRIVVAA